MVQSDMVSLTSFVQSAVMPTLTKINIQATGKGRESFLRAALEVDEGDAEKQGIAKWAAASMYAGGADTVRYLHSPRPLSFISVTDCFRYDVILPCHVFVPRSSGKSAKRNRPDHWDESTAKT